MIKKYSEEKKQEVITARKQGATIIQIATQTGVGRTTVKAWLKDVGLTVNRKWKVDEIQAIFAVFGDDGLTFKAKIRTILENNPAGLLWCGGYIYFGRKVLNDFVYYQQVMTFLENKKGKDFWSLK